MKEWWLWENSHVNTKTTLTNNFKTMSFKEMSLFGIGFSFNVVVTCYLTLKNVDAQRNFWALSYVSVDVTHVKCDFIKLITSYILGYYYSLHYLIYLLISPSLRNLKNWPRIYNDMWTLNRNPECLLITNVDIIIFTPEVSIFERRGIKDLFFNSSLSFLFWSRMESTIFILPHL